MYSFKNPKQIDRIGQSAFFCISLTIYLLHELIRMIFSLHLIDLNLIARATKERVGREYRIEIANINIENSYLNDTSLRRQYSIHVLFLSLSIFFLLPFIWNNTHI